MIFIDYSVYRPSKKWRRKAKKQLSQVAALHTSGDITARNKRIDGRQYVWSEIKSQILLSTINKCWFSEGMNDVSQFHVEHFRPKKLVETLPQKIGCSEQRTANEPNSYWWLAFDYRNYRICGQIINSYKGNFFPLKTGSPTCNSPSSNITTEQVILLDPTVEADTDLLTFDINGMPIPSADPVLHPYDYLRAEVSIKVYGLKDSLLTSARERKLQDVNILINKINRYYQLLLNNPANPDLLEIVFTECTMLVAMANKHQPFSKMVKVYIGYIPYQWAIDYVHPHLR